MKNTTIAATFVRRRLYETTRDSDYYIYEFTDITDSKGQKYPDKWVKETKLMGRVPFKRGVRYEMTLSDSRDWSRSINLPYPTVISWGKEKVYLKNGNAIISVDEKGKETNHSIPWTKQLGIPNFRRKLS